MLEGGVVVADHVQLDAGVGGGDFFRNLRNSWCRCFGLHASAVMRPAATSSGANRVWGRCALVVGHGHVLGNKRGAFDRLIHAPSKALISCMDWRVSW
jgi:hypothetical protein